LRLQPSISAHKSEQQQAEFGGCVQQYADGLDLMESGLGEPIRKIELSEIKTSNRSIVFGAGPGDTASRSMASGLRLLGMNGWHFKMENKWLNKLFFNFAEKNVSKCYSEANNYNYLSIPNNVEFLLDDPIDWVFIHLFRAYPNAKFILSTRQPSKTWADSRIKAGYGALPYMQLPCGESRLEKGVSRRSRDQIANLMDLNNALVRCAVPKERLLEVDVFTASESRMKGLMVELGDFTGHKSKKNKKFPGSKFVEITPGITPGGSTRKLKQVSSSILNSKNEYSEEDVGLLMQKLALNGRELDLKSLETA